MNRLWEISSNDSSQKEKDLQIQSAKDMSTSSLRIVMKIGELDATTTFNIAAKASFEQNAELSFIEHKIS